MKLELPEDPVTALPEDKHIFSGITLFEKLMASNNPDIDLVNDNEYTKFCQLLFIHSQYFAPNPNSDVNQWPLLCCKFAKNYTL